MRHGKKPPVEQGELRVQSGWIVGGALGGKAEMGVEVRLWKALEVRLGTSISIIDNVFFIVCSRPHYLIGPPDANDLSPATTCILYATHSLVFIDCLILFSLLDICVTLCTKQDCKFRRTGHIRIS